MRTGLIQCIFFTFLRCSFTGCGCLADNTCFLNSSFSLNRTTGCIFTFLRCSFTGCGCLADNTCFLNSSFSLNRTTGCIFTFLRCSFTARGCLADNTPVSCFLNSSSFSLNRTTGTFTLDYSRTNAISGFQPSCWDQAYYDVL